MSIHLLLTAVTTPSRLNRLRLLPLRYASITRPARMLLLAVHMCLNTYSFAQIVFQPYILNLVTQHTTSSTSDTLDQILTSRRPSIEMFRSVSPGLFMNNSEDSVLEGGMARSRADSAMEAQIKREKAL